jgi:hypothetical protein
VCFSSNRTNVEYGADESKKNYPDVADHPRNHDVPAETWMQFSNNANDDLSPPTLLMLAEVFKDRLLSLIRIY